MKSSIKIIILAVFILLLSGSMALAQSQEVQKADAELQESTNDLIKAKDNESPFTLSERIKAFKDVLDLSLAEAKDLKVKLLSIDIEDKIIEEWRESVIDNLNKVISHYEDKKEFINENEDSIKESEIIEEAKNLKEWRKENYIPLHNKIKNFILMEKEEKILETANQRWDKIKKDIGVLERSSIKETSTLEEMLSKARNLINKSEEQNNQARNLFIESLTSEKQENATSTTQSSASSTATSTQLEESTSTPSILSSDTESTTTVETKSSTTPEVSGTTTNIMFEKATTTSEKATTTSEKSTTTSEKSTSTPDSLDISIRDLVSSSLNNVKGSYQVFIEMSNFVRELLE